jgi:ATP-dependent 26S proteasome regulatory subunit
MDSQGNRIKKPEDVEMPEYSVLFLKDYHAYAKKDNICRKFRNLIPTLKCHAKVLVIISHTIDIPPEIEKEITVINFKLPGTEDLKIVLKGLCESATDSSSSGKKVIYPKNDEAILNAALGMTAFEAENAFSVSMVETKTFDPVIIQREKAAVVKKTGLLEVMETNIAAKDIGGQNNLMAWLNARKDCFTSEAKAFGITPPKGLLMVGLPGTGKSLTAKGTGSIFQRPVLRLDLSKIYQKYVGESEDNLRKCLHMAEVIAPCVLFIDELEKAFSGSSGDGDSSGVSQRILGSFLVWLQEKTADVFVVATANDVSKLPAALLRGGRFDAIFWLDLPDDIQRNEIIKIHINKIGRKIADFDLPALVKASDKFTGAEIEVWVKESLVLAYSKKEDLKTEHLLEKKREISLISNLMADQIKDSQDWAKKHDVKQAYLKPEVKITMGDPSNGKRKVDFN